MQPDPKEALADLPDEPTEAQEADPVEAEARELGWVPEHEWKGPKSVWKPAGEWLENGDRLMGHKLKQAEGQVSKLEAKLARAERDFEERLGRMEKVNRTTLERQAKAIEREYQAKITEATERGDVRGVQQALKDQKVEIEELGDKGEAVADLVDATGRKIPAADQAAAREFADQNPWFTTSRVLNASMNEHFEAVAEEMPGASMNDKLAEARARVAREFPSKFGKRNGSAPNAVESGGRNMNGSGSPGGKYWSQVPSGDRMRAEKDIKSGLYTSREEWAKVYLGVEEEA